MGDPGCGGRLGWDRDGWLHVCSCPLCLSVPRGGGGRGQGDSRSHPCVGSGKIPTPPTPATLCHKGQGHPLPGCTGDIRGDTGVPKHPIACVPGVPPTPSCSRRDAGGGGLCFHPGLCPPALALPQLLEIFPPRKSHGTQNFPPGEAGAHPPGQRSAPELHIPGRDLGGHRGHLSRPHRGGTTGGSPWRGTAESPAAGAVARPLLGCPGAVSMEAASEQERGRGSWELAPSPGSPGAPTAAGGRGPAATAPAKYLPEWHRAMDQPPARPAPRGKARQNTAQPGSG